MAERASRVLRSVSRAVVQGARQLGPEVAHMGGAVQQIVGTISIWMYGFATAGRPGYSET